MSVVIVAGGRRWPLRHGQDPVDLLAEQGLTGQPVRSVLGADGGLLSNFPVDVFDRKDAIPARWPTFGVMLSARRTAAAEWRPNATTYQYAKSLLSTMINAHDRRHIDDPSVTERSVCVDTTGHSSTDLALTDDDKLDLISSGRMAGEKFLAQWDWQEWKDRFDRK